MYAQPETPPWAGHGRGSPYHRACPSPTDRETGSGRPPIKNSDGLGTSGTSVVVRLPLASLSYLIVRPRMLEPCHHPFQTFSRRELTLRPATQVVAFNTQGFTFRKISTNSARGLDTSEVRPTVVHAHIPQTRKGVGTAPRSKTPMARAPPALLLSSGCPWHRFPVSLPGPVCWDRAITQSRLSAGGSLHSDQQPQWWRLTPRVSHFGKYQPTSAH